MPSISHHPVSQETCIAFEDYRRMHREDQRGTLEQPVPLWSQSDEKVRKVVAFRICLTAGEPNVPSDLAGLRAIEPRYLARCLKSGSSNASQQHYETVQRFGGPLAYFTSLLYRRFRLHEDSVELARQYGIHPGAIRQQLTRMYRIARVLFPDPAQHLEWHKTATRRDVPSLAIKRNYSGVPANVAEAAKLYHAGRPWEEVLKAYGCRYTNEVRRAFKKHGLYVPRSRGRKTKIDLKKALALRAEGLSFAETARRLGSTQMAVFSAMKRAGLHTPQPRTTLAAQPGTPE